MLSTLSERETIISATFVLSSANAFILDESKILPFGKGFNNDYIVIGDILFVICNYTFVGGAEELAFDQTHTCHNFFRQIRDNGLNFPGFVLIFQDRLR